MYYDYTLRFADEQEANNILGYHNIEAVASDENNVFNQSKYTAVDVIGKIYETFEETTKIVPGWYVNVRHIEQAPELDPYKVFFDPPIRAWA